LSILVCFDCHYAWLIASADCRFLLFVSFLHFSSYLLIFFVTSHFLRYWSAGWLRHFAFLSPLAFITFFVTLFSLRLLLRHGWPPPLLLLQSFFTPLVFVIISSPLLFNIWLAFHYISDCFSRFSFAAIFDAFAVVSDSYWLAFSLLRLIFWLSLIFDYFSHTVIHQLPGFLIFYYFHY